MDAATIQQITSLAIPTMAEVGGLPYSTRPLTLVTPPMANSFKVSTLDGFVNMLEGSR